MNRITRNIEIAGKRTSFRLEASFWEALTICARQKGIPLGALVSDIVGKHPENQATMSSMVRVFLITHFHNLAEKGTSHGTA